MSLTPSSISTAREGVYPAAWKVAIYPREGRILYTVGIHHLSKALFNEPTVVHRLVSASTGVGLHTNAPRNALAKSQAMFTKLKPVHLCYTTKTWRGETNASSCQRTLTIYTKEMT